MLMISFSLLLTAVHASDITAINFEYTNRYENGPVWSDRGSGGDNYVSFWRASIIDGYCSLGDIAKKGSNYDPPTFKTLLVKAIDEKAMVHPSGFKFVWADIFSGADKDVAVYTMLAPDGYICLGNAVTNTLHRNPDKSRYCCVKSEYLVRGHLDWTYDDTGTGSSVDFACWTVTKVANTNGLAGGNFLSAWQHTDPGLKGYLLAHDGVKVKGNQTLTEIFISNVQYDLTFEKKASRPITGEAISLENKSNITQSVRGVLSYDQTTSSSFNFQKSFGVGIDITFKAGLPLIGSAETKISASTTFTWNNGTTNSISIGHTLHATLTVPPGKKAEATIVATEYTANIPYNATVKKVHADHSVTEETMQGIFEGVTIVNFHVVYGKFKDIEELFNLSQWTIHRPPPPTWR